MAASEVASGWFIKTQNHRAPALTASKGSVYVEFQVAKNSLIQGDQANWFKALGPSASKSQKFMLNKQGGELLPKVTNLTKVLKVK